MTFIDIHCHLDFKHFDKDREQLIEEMKKQNIIAITNTLNPKNYEYAKSLFKNTTQIIPIPGLYPQDAEKIEESKFQAYLNKIEQENPLAIGEVGLDRHHTKDPKLWQIQENRLKKLIELAIKLNKPIIIHTRGAEEQTIQIIKEYTQKTKYRKFILHCFSGKKKLINEIKTLNIYCSVPLIVLSTTSFQLLVKMLPVTQLLAETDSPYLNPKKERNSPLNIPLIYGEIAKIKGLDPKEIETIIYRNYQKLFK